MFRNKVFSESIGCKKCYVSGCMELMNSQNVLLIWILQECDTEVKLYIEIMKTQCCVFVNIQIKPSVLKDSFFYSDDLLLC